MCGRRECFYDALFDWNVKLYCLGCGRLVDEIQQQSCMALLFRNLGGRQEKKKVTVFFHALAKTWPSLCYENQEGANEF